MSQNEDPSNSNHREQLAQGALSALQKDFVVIGKTRVKGWHAWLLIGVVAGITAGILLVASRSGEIEKGLAQGPTSIQIVVAEKAQDSTNLGNSKQNLVLAQSFVIPAPDNPSSTVVIEKVSFALSKRRNPVQPIIVSIRETLDGADLIATQVVPSDLSEEPTRPTWVDVSFAAPLNVTPIKTYFLVLSLAKEDGSHFYRWSYERRNPYKDGSLWVRQRAVAEDALAKISLLVTPPAPTPPPPQPVVTPGVKYYVLKFFIEPALIPDREFAKRALVQYMEDMNAILAKNTTVRLSFDPETGMGL
jgi:hypothetical protein